MHSLRDLQERFAEAVFNPRSYGLDLPIRENGLNGRRRLRIYRNNVFASLTEALRACYPVVERLVGEGFFAYVANRYIRSHPSTSGDLQEFGSEFPEFLEDFPTTRALVCLSDVARLEWARQYVYQALEPEVVELSARLQAVPPKRYGDLRFRLYPAGRPVAVLALSNTADLAGQPEGLLRRGGAGGSFRGCCLPAHYSTGSREGYHYLMRLAHLLNALALAAKRVASQVRMLGVQAFLRFVRESCAHRWLQREWIERFHATPLQLRLQ